MCAAHVSGGGSAILSHSSISNCSALHGGAAHVDGRGTSLLILQRTSIVVCTASGHAGAILSQEGSEVVLTANSSIEDCEAGSRRVMADPSGGALSVQASILTVNSSRLSRCRVTTGTSKGGGIFAGADSAVQLDVDASFVSCTSAYSGGGLDMQRCTLSMKGCTVENCATGAWGGGGASFHAMVHVHLVSCLVDRCSSTSQGGGMRVESSRLTIEWTVIRDCWALVGGGVRLGVAAG